MNIISKTFVLIFLFIGFSSFAQSFNDTIFTKNFDTIICKIKIVNHERITYSYKKKNRIKSGKISQEYVHSYRLSNKYSIDITGRYKYPKCDECKNWLMFKVGDTAYYKITPEYMFEEKKLISKIKLSTDQNSLKVKISDIKILFYDDLIYKSFKLSKFERMGIYSNSKAYTIKQQDFLSYIIIDGKTPLNIFCFFVDRTDNSIMAGINPSLMNDYSDYRFHWAYYIFDKNKRVVIPNDELGFIEFIEKYLSDRQDIVSKVKSKQYTYADIEEIFRLYNE